jgi:hypothetical protein
MLTDALPKPPVNPSQYIKRNPVINHTAIPTYGDHITPLHQKRIKARANWRRAETQERRAESNSSK